MHLIMFIQLHDTSALCKVAKLMWLYIVGSYIPNKQKPINLRINLNGFYSKTTEQDGVVYVFGGKTSSKLM